MIGNLKFPTKNNLLYLLVESRLKLIFHGDVQVLILAKSSFKSLVDLVVCSTTDNIDVSSAKNFRLYAKSSDKSFMYVRKNSSQV